MCNVLFCTPRVGQRMEQAESLPSGADVLVGRQEAPAPRSAPYRCASEPRRRRRAEGPEWGWDSECTESQLGARETCWGGDVWVKTRRHRRVSYSGD